VFFFFLKATVNGFFVFVFVPELTFFLFFFSSSSVYSLETQNNNDEYAGSTSRSDISQQHCDRSLSCWIL